MPAVSDLCYVGTGCAHLAQISSLLTMSTSTACKLDLHPPRVFQ